MFSQEERDELVKQIEEAQKREEGDLASEIKAVEEEIVSDPENDVPVEEEEEKAAEEEEKQPEKVEEEEQDNSAFARIRREKAAEKKRAEQLTAEKADLERQLQELRAPKQQEEQEAAPEIAPEVQELLRERQITRAEREFGNLESKFRAREPEYDAVSQEYRLALASSIKMHNPKISNDELWEKTKLAILAKAGNYLREGFDPIEELFHEAKELGFNGKSIVKDEPKEEKQVKPRPDMNKVAANRARNAGTNAPSGGGQPILTREAAAALPINEWMKLSVEEKQRVLNPS